MLDIDALMERLKDWRPVFHSEADFQHALAWCIHEQPSGLGVRLEYKPVPQVPEEPMYVDLWVPDIRVAVELKYRTRKLCVRVGEESFSLRNHAAVPQGRYDFLKDVQRLESLSAAGSCGYGFAILLTNDPLYWKPGRKSDPVDGAFHIFDGRWISGDMAWSERASSRTKEGREEPIRLRGSYRLQWCNYAEPDEKPYSRFRYLAVEIAG